MGIVTEGVLPQGKVFCRKGSSDFIHDSLGSARSLVSFQPLPRLDRVAGRFPEGGLFAQGLRAPKQKRLRSSRCAPLSHSGSLGLARARVINPPVLARCLTPAARART